MIRLTAADLEIWTRLVAEATRCVASPGRSTVELEKWAHKAHHAVLPCEPYTRGNPYLALQSLAVAFAGQPAVRRMEMSGELARALDAASAARRLSAVPPGALSASEAEARTVPFRRDIDG